MAPTETAARVADKATRDFSLLRRQGAWRDALQRRLLAAADTIALLVSARLVAELDTAETALWMAVGLPFWLLIAKAAGLYDRDQVQIRPGTLGELSSIFHWATCGTMGTVLATAIAGYGPTGAVPIAAMWATTFLLAVALRAAARRTWRRNVPAERGLIVGSGELADAFTRKLTLETGHHLDLNDAALDDASRLPELLTGGGFDRVIVAMPDLDESTLARVVSACRAHRVKLSVAPPLSAMLGTAVELSHLAELPLIEFRTWDPSRSTMLLKRTVDVVASAVALVVLAPVMAAIAVAVKLDPKGPALFRQRRTGRYGKPFTMVKFRTMEDGAEARLGDVVDVAALTDPMFKIRHDPRVTRIGRLLRALSLDELPQLFNVLRGDMSLVGPRPEEKWLTDRYREEDRFRFDVRPGLTGPMQVHGRGELTFDERLAVEREYIENHSLARDFEILLRTVPAVVRRYGAY